ncbi:hypothetical protein OG528_17990 [Streptomyces platensis]|uniref:hypothetical protein n=2 Tax=Streptomyces platensis TaxID=58346 RepID=UPI0030E35E15
MTASTAQQGDIYMKNSRRSATLGAAISAVALTGLAVAPAAHADNIKCDISQMKSGYYSVCSRHFGDNHTGRVEIDMTDNSEWRAMAYFNYKTGTVELFNYTDRKIRYILQWKDSSGKAHTSVDQVLTPGNTEDWHMSFRKGTQIGVAVGSTSVGKAAMGSFRAG